MWKSSPTLSFHVTIVSSSAAANWWQWKSGQSADLNTGFDTGSKAL
jgi:hypothetical protein